MLKLTAICGKMPMETVYQPEPASGFPDFTDRDAAIQQPDDAKGPRVQFRSWPHTLIARTIEGNYLDYRQLPIMPLESGEFGKPISCQSNHHQVLGLGGGNGRSWDVLIEGHQAGFVCRCQCEQIDVSQMF